MTKPSINENKEQPSTFLLVKELIKPVVSSAKSVVEVAQHIHTHRREIAQSIGKAVDDFVKNLDDATRWAAEIQLNRTISEEEWKDPVKRKAIDCELELLNKPREKTPEEVQQEIKETVKDTGFGIVFIAIGCVLVLVAPYLAAFVALGYGAFVAFTKDS